MKIRTCFLTREDKVITERRDKKWCITVKKTINGLRQSYREKLNDSIKCSVSNNLSRNIMSKGCAQWVAFQIKVSSNKNKCVCMFLLEFRQSISVTKLNFVVLHLLISLMYIVLFFASGCLVFKSMKFVLLSHDREINVQDNRNQMGKFFGRYPDAKLLVDKPRKLHFHLIHV